MLIGEVSRHSGISARMLRHYDSIGLVSPSARTAAGYREYSVEDLGRLFQVESLRSLGLSLPEVRDALDGSGFAPARLVEELIARTRERIARETELLHRLQGIRASTPEQWSEILGLVSLMRGLRSGDPSRRQASALQAIELGASPGVLAEAMLAETVPNVAGTLRWALERWGDEALDPLVRALDSPEEPIRRRAVLMIAELSTHQATAALTAALTHADDEVRYRAALALGTRGEAGALPVLHEMVVAGHDDVEAAEALGMLARRHAAADSIAGSLAGELRRRPEEPQVRRRLVQALAELPAAATREILEGLRHDADPGVASTAAYVLARLERSP